MTYATGANQGATLHERFHSPMAGDVPDDGTNQLPDCLTVYVGRDVLDVLAVGLPRAAACIHRPCPVYPAEINISVGLITEWRRNESHGNRLWPAGPLYQCYHRLTGDEAAYLWMRAKEWVDTQPFFTTRPERWAGPWDEDRGPEATPH